MGTKIVSFTKNTLFSFISKITPILFSIIYTLIIANYLGPENYGIFNYALAFVQGIIMLSGVALLNDVLFVFNQKIRSNKLLYSILAIQYAISLIVFLAMFFFLGGISSYIKVPQNIMFFGLMIIFFLPINTALATFFKSTKNFGKVAKASFIENVVNLSAAYLAIFLFSANITGLIIAKLLAFLISSLYFINVFHKTPKPERKGKIESKGIIRYAKWNIPCDFIRTGIHQLRLIAIGLFVSPLQIGFYYFGQKICDLVFGTINSAVSEVIFPYINEQEIDREKIGSYVSVAIRVSLIVNGLIFIAIILLVPTVIALFFPKYTGAFLLLMFWSASYLLSPIEMVVHVFKAINKMDKALIGFLVALTVNVIILIALAPKFGGFAIIGSSIATHIIALLVYIPLIKSEGIKIDLIPKIGDFRLLIELSKRIKNKYSIEK